MSADYGPGLWLGNASIHYGGWGIFVPRWIIVHKTAGDQTVQAVAATFAARGTSTHYAVGEDGTVAQYVPENQAAWGNGGITGPAAVAVPGDASGPHDAWWDGVIDHNPNTQTFSIEHCTGSVDNSAPITPAQQAASFALIKHLCDAHNIPYHVFAVSPYSELATGGITGHFSMDPANRAFCPGPYPWAALYDYLINGGQTMGVPGGWSDSANGDASNYDGVLKAPNGVPVIHGFRNFVLTHPWASDNWPLAPEQGVSHPDPLNPTGCAGSYQLFRETWLIWQECDGHIFPRYAGEVVAVLAQQLHNAGLSAT
jgi:hypothetical protein